VKTSPRSIRSRIVDARPSGVPTSRNTPSPNTRAIILVAADKGLCGALNTNVFRLAQGFDIGSTIFITAGRKAAQFVARTKRRLAAEFPYGDTPRYSESRAIAALARDLFLKGEVDEVRIVATRFVNTMTQQPIAIEFLPIGPIASLAVPGLLLSTLLIGLIVALATPVPLGATLLLGAILSATDPVASPGARMNKGVPVSRRTTSYEVAMAGLA